MRVCCALLALLTICLLGSSAAWASEPDDALAFSRDIRPILADKCFQCHGPDAKHRKADLRLDQQDGVETVFEPGDVESSEAWLRINSDDDEERMPPPSSHKQLDADEIARIEKWIQQGSEWQGHWSFVAPSRHAVPDVRNQQQVLGPIDAFILERLEADGRNLSPPADRERLLRRVTFDLTGMPPTITEIDAFLSDNRSNAYEIVVDRLLESTHYGERMALAWMDAARYGDTSVFHADGPRDMWPWRDWVIRAYNSNMPFDQFTIEQLAGDLLPSATRDQMIATGFNRNNASTDEGGAIAEEYRVEYAVDRVKTTSMVWLGLTVECAQCHDHKYDPISQREYYEFYAYFNQAADPGMQSRGGNEKPLVDVLAADSEAQADEHRRALDKLQQQLADE